MKIVFNDSELSKGIINVSLNGGFTYTDYEIAEVKESGIPLNDSQDYEKIKIKGPANTLKRLDVITTIPSDGETTEKPNFIIDKETYGFSFPECIVGITLPDGITSITKSLTSSSSSTENGFSNFPNLHSIVIPSSVTKISDYAFYYCKNLTSIDIPSSVTSIGNNSFYGCSKLTIRVDENNQNYSTSEDGKVLFNKNKTTLICYPSVNDDYTVPDSVTTIGEWAFSGCTSLTNINIPDNVTSIGEHAFYECSKLTSVTIPEGVTSIGRSAFHNCSNLTSITIPESVTSIGSSAFIGCRSLTSINIPDGVTSIGSSTFQSCTSLTSITIPEGVASIGYGAFQGCYGLTSINIPNSVSSIGDYAFKGCSKLTIINYTGTEEQWKTISKGTSWNTGCPSSLVIKCDYQG